MQDLAVVWECTRQTVYDVFYRQRPLSPAHIDLAAQLLGLDDFDTNQLRLLGAREAGWNIQPQFLLETTND